MAKQKMEQPLQTLLASARKLTKTDLDSNRHRKIDAPWQNDAWDMYDLVGEFRFIVNAIASKVSKATVFLARLGDDGEVEEQITSGEMADEYLKVFGQSTAGREQLLRRMGLNLLVPGECWTVGLSGEVPEYDGTNVPEFEVDSEAETSWHVLSVSEIRKSKTGDRMEVDLPDGPVSVDPDMVDLVRIWEPHPRIFNEADSGTRAALPILRELVGLTMYISAQVDSRLAGAGILVIPQSAQRALREAAGVPDDAYTDEFTEALMEAMLTPIQDRSNASSIVPLTVTVPDEAVGKFEHISFSTPFDGQAKELREEALRRLSMSMEAPPELLLGQSGMNHWGSWLVSEDTIRSHVEPLLAIICDALTTQYLWPTMEANGVEDFDRYAIWFDVEHLIIRPNAEGDAKEMHSRGVITDEAVLRELGFDKADASSEVAATKRAESALFDMVTADPSMLQDGEAMRKAMQNLEALFGKGSFTEEEEPEPVPPQLEQPAEGDEGENEGGEGDQPDSRAPEGVGEPEVAS